MGDALHSSVNRYSHSSASHSTSTAKLSLLNSRFLNVQLQSELMPSACLSSRRYHRHSAYLCSANLSSPSTPESFRKHTADHTNQAEFSLSAYVSPPSLERPSTTTAYPTYSLFLINPSKATRSPLLSIVVVFFTAVHIRLTLIVRSFRVAIRSKRQF